MLVSSGASWKYFTGSFAGAGWNTSSFSDAAWSTGPSQLGFGEGDEATVIPSGPSGNYYPTAYFRTTFNVTNASLFGTLALKVKRDDGVVIYLNGTEIFRDNISAGDDADTSNINWRNVFFWYCFYFIQYRIFFSDPFSK